jgi:hypothetical protein
VSGFLSAKGREICVGGEGVEEKLGSLVWSDRVYRTIFEGNFAFKEVCPGV